MIEIRNLNKTFFTAKEQFQVLKNVNLNVREKEILGIIGPSGAGKSTLLRCMNFLEKPCRGTVRLDGALLNHLAPRDLRRIRQKTGMIFQEFNLYQFQTAAENIAFPLKIKKVSRGQIKNRVIELLELVGIADKADAYPAQLSGGQKQRVGIARALACQPKILFCDEATSSLDEKNSLAILDLMKKINRALGLTIVLITHEKEVVQNICTRVVSLEKGKLIEPLFPLTSQLPAEVEEIKKEFPHSDFLYIKSPQEFSKAFQIKGELVWTNGISSLWLIRAKGREKVFSKSGLELKGVFL